VGLASSATKLNPNAVLNIVLIVANSLGAAWMDYNQHDSRRGCAHLARSQSRIWGNETTKLTE
jgi:hypothetical protein